MAILIIEQHGRCEAGTLSGRVLIGRWPDNSVVIDDKSVSRIHAWIGLQDGRYYIADAGSRTGTFVNDEALHERHVLYDGDRIRIGPAMLRYRTESEPPNATAIDLSPRTPEELSGKQGVFMDCVCGAPLWLPSNFAGVGQCRYCGHTVTQGIQPVSPPAEEKHCQQPPSDQAAMEIPAESMTDPLPAITPRAQNDDDFEALMKETFTKTNLASPVGQRVPPIVPAARPTSRNAGPVVPMVPASKATMPVPLPATNSSRPAATLTPAAPPRKTPPRANPELEQVCGICHGPITVFDEVNTCPSCGLGFHADCWQENHGCSAYGCPQVGAAGKHG